MKFKYLALVAVVTVAVAACGNKKVEQTQEPVQEPTTNLSDKYAEYTLTTDISHLSENEREMLPLLFEAADIMDDLFWMENYGDKDELMAKIKDTD